MKRRHCLENQASSITASRNAYHFIGHQTGAPFLAIVFPHEAELWDYEGMACPVRHIADQYDLIYVDLLEIRLGVLISWVLRIHGRAK